MRPIKGTLGKDKCPTLAQAEEFFANDTKERAENLMILDLIRHDLYGILGPGNVRVKKCMGVEEFEKVFQLVSVIEGQWEIPKVECSVAPLSMEAEFDPTPTPLRIVPSAHLLGKPARSPISQRTTASTLAPSPGSDHANPRSAPTGLAILASSLPPGSMTGAPKKRSCELLTQIEGPNHPRGIYSGIIGYLDVGGAGDFCVVIRTAHHWDWECERDEQSGEEYELWRLGAGGAITTLSSAEGEVEEMLLKANSTLRMFWAASSS